MDHFEKLMQELEIKKKEIQKRLDEQRSIKNGVAENRSECSSASNENSGATQKQIHATPGRSVATSEKPSHLVSIPMELNQLFWIPIQPETTDAIDEIRTAYTFPNPLYEAEKKRRGHSNRTPTHTAVIVDDPDAGFVVARGNMRFIIRTLQKNGVNPEIVENLPNHPILDPPYRLTRSVDPEHLLCLAETKNRRFGIVTGDPGAGRIAYSAAWLAEKSVRVLVVVREKAQLYEWERVLRRNMALSEDDLALIGDGHKGNAASRVTIGIDRSLYRQIDDDFRDRFGAVIIDMVDTATAKIFFQIVGKVRSRYILGLSGYRSKDPDSFDKKWRHSKGLTGLARAYVGPVLFEWTSKNNIWGKGVQVAVHRVYTEFEYEFNDDYKAMITELVRSPTRNNQLVEAIIFDAASSERKILIVTERKEHMETLDSAIRAAHFEPGIIDGDVAASQVETFEYRLKRRRMSIVLTTNKSVRTAVQIATYDSIFIATPIRAVDHLLVVIFGSLGGQSPKIYEFVDERVPVLAGSHRARMKLYREQGFQIL